MDQLLKFISDNSTQIWTLISVVIGGIVTYISTSAAENRKDKKHSQREKMVEVLIPYCTCVEETLLIAKKIYISDDFFQYSDAFEKYLDELKKPLAFLNSSKRIYLSEKSRTLLNQYKSDIERFEDTINQECDMCLIKYKQYISNILANFKNVPYSMNILYSMKEIASLKVKLAIIRRTQLTLVNDFTYVEFVQNDDIDNYRFITVSIDDKIRRLSGEIDYGVTDINDLDADSQLGCILLEFLNKNTLDEKRELATIIDETSGSSLFTEMNDTLGNILNKLTREIDKIAE